jgi:hypothetical protein
MGFYEDDRIRHKNLHEKPKEVKQNENYFKLEVYEGVSVSEIVEAMAKAGLEVRLGHNNKISVRKK